MQKAVVYILLSLQFAQGLNFESTYEKVDSDDVSKKMSPFDLLEDFPATSNVAHHHHHRSGPFFDNEEPKEEGNYDAMGSGHLVGWTTFLVVIIFGCTAETLALKTWERDMDIKTACTALVFWMFVAGGFCGFLHYQNSHVYTWIDGYLLEVMLSFDNLFVFVLIMDAFRIPSIARNRLLLLSVVYCFACRLAMFEAVAALKSFASVVTQVLGVFIAYCAYKVMMLDDDDDEDFANSPAIQFLSSFFPVTTQVDERGSFFIDGKATASFLGLLALIVFDTIFAVDSVSAKSALIQSTYINFTSSGFAMIMLRAAYFLLDNAVDMFKYLKYGIGIILFVIAFMAIFPGVLPISNFQYCCILLAILTISITGSVVSESLAGKEEDEEELISKPSSNCGPSRLRLSEDATAAKSDA